MKRRGSHRLIKRLGLALAVATIVTPAAQAMPLDVSHRDVASQTRIYADDLRAPTPSPQVAIQTRKYADDLRAPVPTPQVGTSQTRRYADDLRAPSPSSPVSRQVRRYPDDVVSPQPRVEVPRLVSSTPSRFDWSDAGLGAVGAFGLMLLGGAAILGVRHTRRGRLAAA